MLAENRENRQPSRATCGTFGPVGGLCGCLRSLTDDAKQEIIPGHESAWGKRGAVECRASPSSAKPVSGQSMGVDSSVVASALVGTDEA